MAFNATHQIYEPFSESDLQWSEETLERVYRIAQAFFSDGGLTADFGSRKTPNVQRPVGSGFPTSGNSSSAGYLGAGENTFPELPGSANESFQNIICVGVLEDLPQLSIVPAILNLSRILKPGGRLILGFRTSKPSRASETEGSTSSHIIPGKILLTLEAAGLHMVFRETFHDDSSPSLAWEMIAAEKEATGAARGLERIQSVLAREKMTATYKLALIRGLCMISKTQGHAVHWRNSSVYVPMRSLAASWIRYYWPIMNNPSEISQVTGSRAIGFRSTMFDLANSFGRAGLFAFLSDLDQNPSKYEAHLREVSVTIRKGPITHAGTSNAPVFRYEPNRSRFVSSTMGDSLGWIVVPEAVWLDLVRFNHWIEDSVVLRWAQLTCEMNPDLTLSEIIPLLLSSLGAERNTSEIRQALQSELILQRLGGSPTCVWTGKKLVQMQVDHLIPFSLWGNNDLWNLLPAHPTVNNQKRDFLPSRQILVQCEDAILHYWRIYYECLWGNRFGIQIERALGPSAAKAGWERLAFVGLVETVERLALTNGTRRWP